MTKLTELVMQYKQTGDDHLVNVIIENVTPFVHAIINQSSCPRNKKVAAWYFRGDAHDDLVDECLTVILTRCIQQFNPELGCEFLTHFGAGVRNTMRNRVKHQQRQKRRGESKTLPFSYEIDDDGNTIECLLVDKHPDTREVREVVSPGLYFSDLEKQATALQYQVALALYNGDARRAICAQLDIDVKTFQRTRRELQSMQLAQELF